MSIANAIMTATARKAAKVGQSANAWIRKEREAGRSLSRTRMLAIYRTANQLEAKKDRLQYVRKDRFPSKAIMAESSWEWQTEYAYYVKVHSQLHPDDPLETRMVTILSDNPMTPGDIESQVRLKWVDEEKYGGQRLLTVVPMTVIRRVA